MVDGAAKIGVDRIELYTEAYASLFLADKIKAIESYKVAADYAVSVGLGVNAGLDLDLSNLNYFTTKIPQVEEVSIGHALVCDALYLGLENTIQMYLRASGKFRK